MTRFLVEKGVESRFIDGFRVTTPEVLDAVLKIFAGTVNAELVAAFRAAGARPVGLTGLDAGVIDAEPLDPDLGHVGRPVPSDARLLHLLVCEGFLPVVACVAGDAKGAIFNVNGDQMAAACASSFRAEKLIFLTDVEGVRDASGATREVLTQAQARALILEGAATGGMRAKLEAALCALGRGMAEVRIAPGSFVGIIEYIVSDAVIGTRLIS